MTPEPNCVCRTCGEPFYCKPSQIRWRNGGQHCSRACKEADPSSHRRGSDHPAWKGDDASPADARARAQRMYELGDCQRCGAAATDRHHRDGNPYNNARANVVGLCRACHMEEDGRSAALAKRNAKPTARERVRELYSRGAPTVDIVREVGVSRTTVRRWTGDIVLVSKPPGDLTPEQTR